MELKKTPKADLENKKLFFKEVGLIATLLIIFFVIEWKTYETQISTLDSSSALMAEEEMIPITNEEPPPPPEAPKQPILSDVIEIMDDDVMIEDEIIINTEDDSSLGVDIKDYIEGDFEEEIIEEIPFAIVEDKPLFNGKDPISEFNKWIYSKMDYPEIARENGIQGRVTVSFIVDIDGSLRDIKIARGVDSALDKEALRVVGMSPKWTPGKQRNKPVRVRYVFPIVFELR